MNAVCTLWRANQLGDKNNEAPGYPELVKMKSVKLKVFGHFEVHVVWSGKGACSHWSILAKPSLVVSFQGSRSNKNKK